MLRCRRAGDTRAGEIDHVHVAERGGRRVPHDPKADEKLLQAELRAADETDRREAEARSKRASAALMAKIKMAVYGHP